MDPGMKVLLDDGAVILTVTQINDNDGCVVCSIDNSGELRSRAGVNLPGAETDLPAMSDKDKKDIKYGLEIDVDYVAASFIQTAEGVTEIRNYMRECAKEMGLADRPLPLIISKIESQSALKHFDEILQESDGIMVARGGKWWFCWTSANGLIVVAIAGVICVAADVTAILSYHCFVLYVFFLKNDTTVPM